MRLIDAKVCVTLLDIRIVTGFGSRVMPISSVLIAACASAHPYSPSSCQSSPGILDSKVSLFNLLICLLGLQVNRIVLLRPR